MKNDLLGRILVKIGGVIDTVGFKMIMAFDEGILCITGNKLMGFATKIQTIGHKIWWLNEFMAERQG